MLESYQRLGRIQAAQLREAAAVGTPTSKKKSARLDLQNLEVLNRLQTSCCKVGRTHTDFNQLLPPQSDAEYEEGLLRFVKSNKACQLTWSIGDYQDVKIKDNSVIYCDIPYQDTNKYVGDGENFDYERFYDWCLRQTQPLYISSYEMPEKDFKVVAEFARVDTMSASCNGKLVAERVFMPRTQETKGNIQLSLF